MKRSQRKIHWKDELTWPAHILTCSPRLITCLSIKRYQFTGRDMPLQKSSGVAILVTLQERGFFQPRTVHRATNSEKPQVKIRFAFHFVERKKKKTKTFRSRHSCVVHEGKTKDCSRSWTFQRKS